MLIGKLDQRILFQSLTEQNIEGGLIKAWATDSPPDEVWGRVYSQRGTETFEAARVNARETIRVLVRFRDDITDKHRLTWNSQAYDIKFVDRSERRKGELWLTAEVSGAV